MKPLNQVSVTIPAIASGTPGVAIAEYEGAFLLVTAATADFQMQFDTGSVFQCAQGFKFNQSFSRLTFTNNTANPIVVNLIVGTASVDYVGSTNQAEAPTYAKGNLGCNSAAAVTALTNGTVTGYKAITAKGTGYVVGDLVTVTGGTGTAATFTVKTVNSSGGVTGLTLTTPGSYSVLPTNTIFPSGGTGIGLGLTCTFNPAASGLSWDATNKCLELTTAAQITVPNFDGANRRKSIVFQVLNIISGSNNSSSLLVQDLNGNICQRIAPGQVIGVDSSAQLILSSLGEVAGNTVCEFLAWETYYAPF